MYLIVGLGNPEPEYSRTRHNMGFLTINELAKKYQIELSRNKFEGIYGTGIIENKKVILLKPQTYMNLSGKCIRQFVEFYQIPMDNLIIIYDDIDTEKGAIRIRKKGGPGTHNGMKSVVEQLQNGEFPRVRVGIGSPTYKNDMINYVIGNVEKEEFEILEKATKVAADAVSTIIKENLDKAMNKYN